MTATRSTSNSTATSECRSPQQLSSFSMEGMRESHEGLSPCRSSCWAALVVLLQVTRWEQRSGQQTHGHKAQQSSGPGIAAGQGVTGAYPAGGQMALRKCVIPCGKTASGAGFPALTDLTACPCRCFSDGLWVRPWAGSEHLRASVCSSVCPRQGAAAGADALLPEGRGAGGGC